MRRLIVTMLAGGVVMASTARAAGDYPLLDDLTLNMGRITRDGGDADVNFSVKNGTGVRLSFIGVTCSALDQEGMALDTASGNIENLPAGATGHDKALFFHLPQEARFECRVDNYDE